MNRRCKVVRVSDDFLIHAIMGRGDGLVPPYRVDGLPNGWQIERVGHNFHAACIELLISHPSFDEVPAGEMFPLMTDVCVYRAEPDSVVLDTVKFKEFL